MTLARMKNEARKLELREEWEQAIELYLKALTSAEEKQSDQELPLYNRVGDLYIRLGRPEDAVGYYERAADRYADDGLYNNAIALCNKALRYAPRRTELLRKLGKFSAAQGFLTDARRWFLEYAETMFRQGSIDAAFEALEDFAGLSNDPGIRVLLARRLKLHGRGEQALRELARAYQLHRSAGDDAGAESVKTEALELDAEAEAVLEAAVVEDHWSGEAVEAGESGTEEEAGDEGTDEIAEGGPSAAAEGEPTGVAEADDPVVTEERLEGFESTHFDAAEEAPPEAGPASILDASEEESSEHPGDASSLPPLPTYDDAPAGAGMAEAEPLPGLEATSLGEPAAEVQAQIEEGRELARRGDVEGARAAYERAIELDPSNLEASFALDAVSEPDTSVPGEDDLPSGPSGPLPTLTDEPPASDYVDLGDWLGSLQPAGETRYFVEEQEPSGDEDRDFAELLQQLRTKIDENIEVEDAKSHYDLGLAFKDMGLTDEAIRQFQIALRSGDERLKIYEELGQCFLNKSQPNIAVRVLTRALQMTTHEEMELIGVYYYLGTAYEALGRTDEAKDAFERVVGLDVSFRDVMDRLSRL